MRLNVQVMSIVRFASHFDFSQSSGNSGSGGGCKFQRHGEHSVLLSKVGLYEFLSYLNR